MKDWIDALLAPLAWSLAATGAEARSRQVLDRLRPSSPERFEEHIIGANALIAYAEVALLLDDAALVSRATDLLAPYGHMVLGIPWACSFAAADSFSRLAAHRGDIGGEEAHRGTAESLYRNLGAPALLNRRT